MNPKPCIIVSIGKINRTIQGVEREREREREKKGERRKGGRGGRERESQSPPSPLTLCSYIGRLNISEVFMSGVSDALSSHQDGEAKGIKAHFRMDESGLLMLDYVSLWQSP